LRRQLVRVTQFLFVATQQQNLLAITLGEVAPHNCNVNGMVKPAEQMELLAIVITFQMEAHARTMAIV
jgi:hypothetical protein